MKRTNPWETYLPVGTFRNELSFATNPWGLERAQAVCFHSDQGPQPLTGNCKDNSYPADQICL